MLEHAAWLYTRNALNQSCKYNKNWNDECIVTQIARILHPPPNHIDGRLQIIWRPVRIFFYFYVNVIITGEGCNIKAFDGFGIGPRSLFFVGFFGIPPPPTLGLSSPCTIPKGYWRTFLTRLPIGCKKKTYSKFFTVLIKFIVLHVMYEIKYWHVTW